MKYDYKKAKEIIESRKNDIEYASLGMREDWNWTAVVIWQDDKYQVDLDTVEKLAGINGSDWATPTIELVLKNGEEFMMPCYELEEWEEYND